MFSHCTKQKGEKQRKIIIMDYNQYNPTYFLININHCQKKKKKKRFKLFFEL